MIRGRMSSGIHKSMNQEIQHAKPPSVRVVGIHCSGDHPPSSEAWKAVREELLAIREHAEVPPIVLIPRGMMAESPEPQGMVRYECDFDGLEPGLVTEVCECLISLEAPGNESSEVRCAKAIGRSVIRLDAATGEVIERAQGSPQCTTSWLGPLLHAAGVDTESAMTEIQQAMETMAERSAPVTRSRLVRVAVLQTVAVALPLLWFLVAAMDFPAVAAAVSSALGVGFLLGSVWWLRWRSMHLTWARARLVAEVARSFLAVGNSPVRTSLVTVLRTVPAMQPILWRALVSEKTPEEETDWIDSYIRDRIDDQEAYFMSKQEQAMRRRRQISKWATLCMDLGLAVAAAGLVVTLSPRADFLAWVFRGDYLWTSLGIFGVLTAVGLLFLQGLRITLEIDRRTARFAQQREMLATMKQRLQGTDSNLAVALARTTEQSLLAEVIEWYYQSETTEFFFSRFMGRKNGKIDSPLSIPSKTAAPGGGHKAVMAGGSALLFLARVGLGRLPWVVAAGAATLLLITRAEIDHPDFDSRIRDIVWLRDDRLESWSPQPPGEVDGYFIVAHGMRDYVDRQIMIDAVPWMLNSAQLIRGRLQQEGIENPEIILVDWKEMAQPSAQADASLPRHLRLLHDVVLIQPYANLVGRMTGRELAARYAAGEMDPDKPLHLIGHSAGGFVVSEIALQLHLLNWAPEEIHLTILDTPGFESARLHELDQVLPDKVDIYMTTPEISMTAQANAYQQVRLPGVRIQNVESPHTGILASHSYAVEWFLNSVGDPEEEEGFGRSPLLK